MTEKRRWYKIFMRCSVFTEDRIRSYIFSALSVATKELNQKATFHSISMWAVPVTFRLLCFQDNLDHIYVSNLF